ncbi:MAG: sigma-54-dependent transcriptional regulator [Beijerinckiaceae bacterium]
MSVFLIDDDRAVLEAYGQTLELSGLEVMRFATAKAAIAALARCKPLVIITDVRMPDMDGLSLLDQLTSIDKALPVILFSGHADVSMALDAMRRGAWDLLEKPADPMRLIEAVRRATAYRQLQLENRALKAGVTSGSSLESILVGNSVVMTMLRRQVATLANTEIDVLLTGDTGVGKDMVARALHSFGPRAQRHFVAINCGAIPESMIESELFGHEAGAFTGAKDKRIGRIEHADGGTLFLDEIESMPLAAQVRLLRVLQERSVERVGGNKSIAVNLRVIAAAKGDLHAHAKEGRFRSDLAFRLDVARLPLPALRERREDIPLLLKVFMAAAAKRHGLAEPQPLSEQASQRLASHDWPGNVRELRNVAERLALGLFEPLIVDATHSPGMISTTDLSLAERMKKHEATIVAQTLAEQGGRILKAAAALGISRKTLYLKMREHGLVSTEKTT